MLHWLIEVLRTRPEVCFFLVLGLGYLIGRITLGSFKLGAVTGTLLAGVLVGQLGVTVSGDVKQCFFLLFLFSIGFRTGPQFFRGLRSDGLAQAGLAALVAISGLAVAYAVALLFRYDAGTAAGLIAGSLTESATIGTALDAINVLDLPSAARADLGNAIPVAFAVTYLIGVVMAAWFLSQIAPKLLRIDLAEECRKLDEAMSGTAPTGITARLEVELRAYVIDPGSRWVGLDLQEVEKMAPGQRIFVERMRRNSQIVDVSEQTSARAGDILAVSARRSVLVGVLEAPDSGLRETDDFELLAVPGEMVDVVVTNADVDSRTLSEIASDDPLRGVFLRRLTRSGNPLPAVPETRVNLGDVVTLVGLSSRLSAAIKHLGVADRPTDVTDMFVVAMAIVAGALIGIPALHLGGVEIGLSLSVGVLLGGLVCGWIRSVRPQLFGRVPTATLWVFESIGLAGFVAVVGLNAGPDFVAGLQTSGLSLIAAGLLTISIPLLIGLAAGRFIFKMHPGIMLGVIAGGCTATPALAAIQESARSSAPTLGYGVAYAVGNVLLALWGTVIVALMA